MKRTENELRIMHSATDFVKIGAFALKKFMQKNNYTHICIVDKNDEYLSEIAEIFWNEDESQVSFLNL